MKAVPQMPTLQQLEEDVERWVTKSQERFRGCLDRNNRFWVFKCFPPRYLAEFMERKQLVVSTSPGFTWGDGVYVVPLRHAYSAMIYGRIGVMGWIACTNSTRIYDASDPHGISLYQRWIQFKPGWYRLLTTTVHSQLANRWLRNAFRRRFALDLVLFRPDEFNRAYVDPAVDRWCVTFEFSEPVGSTATGFSASIRECEIVAIGTEEFDVDRRGVVRRDLIGSVIYRYPIRHARGRPSLQTELIKAYARNHGRKKPRRYARPLP